MTEVTLHHGDSCSVRCKGHATGHPDVCAAVRHGGRWLYDLLEIGFLQLEMAKPEAISVKIEKK